MEPSKIVSYYADCYQADNREQRLYDFFSKKVEYRYMLEGKEELLNHEFPHISIDGEYAEKLQKKLKVYGKEKDLVYASFFVVGKAMVLGKWQEVRAPLFWYKANLIQDEYEQDFISINFSERIINYSILNIIRTKDEESDFYQKVQEQIPSGKIELNDAVAIGKLLKQYSPEMDVEELYLYPELQGEKAIKTIGKNISKELDESVGKSVFKIVPASGIGLLEKSKQTLRILNELKDLGKLNGKQEYSTALLTLLGEHQTVDTSNVSDFNLSFMIPATLSLEQQKILDSTSNHFLSLVVGPPGTGKSYSISALAIWLMTKGKSVLIASRNDQAVDVIGEKIVNQLFVKNAIVRGGSKKYMKELKSFLGDLLSGVKMNQYKHKSDWNKHHDEYKAIQKELGLVESMFKNQEKTNQERGAFLWETQHKWKPLKYIKTKWYEQQIKKEKTVWESMQMIRDLEEKRKAKTTELIASFRDFQINDVLNNLKERKSLKSFLSSLRARTGNIQEERFLSVDLESLKKVFPIWLINLTDIGKVLPLEKELFDVLIIDEATQCDIATCLPALQRAKKVVFAGDPKQLRHVSFLSYARMDGLRTKYGLPDEDRFDFRKNSILDLVSDSIEQQNQVAFLNEHFRSEPEIIRFSNEQFYQNSLRIMSKKPNNTANTDKNIQIIHCGGKREKQGFNKIEAEKVMLQLQKIVEEQKELETEKVWSIGILSPFRDQVDYFLKMIETDLSLSIIERHQIKVGTAHSFQGDERDVMLLSFAVDNESHPTAFRHLNNSALFNVAITRARKKQFAFISVNSQSLKNDSLFKQYLSQIENPLANAYTTSKSPNINLTWQDEVAQLLIDKGWDVLPDFEIAGMKLDLMVYNKKANHAGTNFIQKNTCFGVDFISPENSDNATSNLNIKEHQILSRAGVSVFPLSYTDWRLQKEKCIESLNSFQEMIQR